jgi:hypothetical protein
MRGHYFSAPATAAGQHRGLLPISVAYTHAKQRYVAASCPCQTMYPFKRWPPQQQVAAAAAGGAPPKNDANAHCPRPRSDCALGPPTIHSAPSRHPARPGGSKHCTGSVRPPNPSPARLAGRTPRPLGQATCATPAEPSPHAAATPARNPPSNPTPAAQTWHAAHCTRLAPRPRGSPRPRPSQLRRSHAPSPAPSQAQPSPAPPHDSAM